MLPYTYSIRPFTHELEEKPHTQEGFAPFRVGDMVTGTQFRNYNDLTKYKGLVTKIKKTLDGIVERVGITVKGKTLWLDPSTVITIEHIDNRMNDEIVLTDDIMDFDE